MFIVFLRFGENKAAAKEYMAAHNDWIAKGMSDGVFMTVGSLQPNAGGCVLMHGESLEAVEKRIQLDPFVEHKVVEAEIHEVSVHKTDARLDFLKG